MKKTAITAAIALLLASCGKSSDPTATASTEAPPPETAAAGLNEASGAATDPAPALAIRPATLTRLTPGARLSQRLDCLRQNGGLLVIGHRGGPTRDYPENALETLERTRKAGSAASEIDIARTKDGVLVLMHDDTLDRTTTGTGPVADQTWSSIQKLNLKTYSKTTDFHPPTLQAALEWAVANGAFLELDKKRSTGFEPVIAAVRAAKAEAHVIFITYTEAQAAEVHKLAPDLAIIATIESESQLDRLVASGVKADNLVAWTGIERPDPALWSALAARGVESAFGTLGRLDDVYWEDRDASEYDALATEGLVLLPTDVSDRVSRQLTADDEPARACGF